MVDRVGNVLAVFEMNDSAKVVTITSSHNGSSPVMGGSKASISFRQRSQLSQKQSQGLICPPKVMRSAHEPHLRSCKRTSTQGKPTNPQARSLAFNLASFLAVTWFRARADGLTMVGPHRSPLGLSADPGGFPLLQAGHSCGRHRVYW